MSDPFKVYKVEFNDYTVYFLHRAEAMSFALAASNALGFREKWDYKDKFDDGILTMECTDKVPGVDVIKGVIDVLDKDEIRDIDDPNAGESEKIVALREQIKKLDSEKSAAGWEKTKAEKKAEEQELLACRLASALDANGIDPTTVDEKAKTDV